MGHTDFQKEIETVGIEQALKDRYSKRSSLDLLIANFEDHFDHVQIQERLNHLQIVAGHSPKGESRHAG